MNGRIFTIVCPDNVEKHPESFVWVGKHTLNQGRRLTPYKRMSNGRLRLRIADELKIPAIPLHEHCSCMWVPYVYLTPDEEERIGRRLSFGHT